MDLFNLLIFVKLNKIFIMKKLLIILLLFPLLSFSQIEIGKTRSQIIAQYSQAPCMTDSGVLTWCVSNGDMISYTFENNRCINIMFSTLYSSKYEADIELEKAINSFARDVNETPIKKGKYAFFRKRNGVAISFYVSKYKNSTYYVIQQYLKVG